MFHLAAYAESIAPNSALTNVAAVDDDTLSTSGDDLTIPDELNNLIGAVGAIDATGAGRVQLTAPSFLRMGYLDVAPFSTGLTVTDPDHVKMFPENPIIMEGDEDMEALVYNTEAVAAEHYVGVFLADGPQSPVQGEIFTRRATMSITNIANTWVSGALTFSSNLPAANYQVVGMRVVEATSVFARLIFIGGQWRPGCVVAPAVTTGDNDYFRNGNLGVWGTFAHNNPPKIEIIGAAGAVTPEVYLDMIQI